ncbi:MAG TPA: glycosyltransferase family 2 protein [Tepidisphaeraceae bacterium]|jgi:undecaprenyl-phosphate 4-deoxy-4-formamido-L-arabinose transferase
MISQDLYGGSEVAELAPGISVVVPVYNSAGTLNDLVKRLRAALNATGRGYEAVLVNDGSADQSWETIEKLCHENPWVRGIDLMRNSGQENALLCGIRAARYDVTATIDDDLQNPPEEIERLAGMLGEGYDVVYGTPEREQHGLWRDAASIITKFVMRHLMGVHHAREVTAFKVFRTELRGAFAHYRNPYVSIDLLLTWGTDRFGALTVRHDRRAVGQSHFTLRKLVRHAITMITGFSVVPLRLASLMGFAFSLLGLGVLVYVVVEYLVRGSPVPGFPFLAAIIAIFSGAQMLALGIIGEYLARVHMHSLGREPYAVRHIAMAKSVAATPADQEVAST